MLVERGHGAVHPWVQMLDRAALDDCHAAGLEVNTWTCDDPARMAELIDWGIDGICTNVPDVAASWFEQHAVGLRLTAFGRCSNSSRGVSPR